MDPLLSLLRSHLMERGYVRTVAQLDEEHGGKGNNNNNHHHHEHHNDITRCDTMEKEYPMWYFNLFRTLQEQEYTKCGQLVSTLLRGKDLETAHYLITTLELLHLMEKSEWHVVLEKMQAFQQQTNMLTSSSSNESQVWGKLLLTTNTLERQRLCPWYEPGNVVPFMKNLERHLPLPPQHVPAGRLQVRYNST